MIKAIRYHNTLHNGRSRNQSHLYRCGGYNVGTHGLPARYAQHLIDIRDIFTDIFVHRAQTFLRFNWHDRLLVFYRDMVRCTSIQLMMDGEKNKRGKDGMMLTATCSWSALGGVLVTGVNAGGPPVMIWGWLGICCVALCVAYSMAEMCSEYPVAGGKWSFLSE